MTRYKVSFEIESDEQWEPMASRKYGTVKVLGHQPLVVQDLTVPSDAEIEEISEPFEAGYYGCYDTTSGELNWLKPFNSAEDLAWSRKWMLKTQEIVPVSISRASKLFIGDIVVIKHAFEYSEHAGKTGYISETDPQFDEYKVTFEKNNYVTSAWFPAKLLKGFRR